MQFAWRAMSGPALAAATVLFAFLIDRYLVAVPNPAPLLICIVAFAGSLSGLGSGAITAAIAIVCSALVFFDHRETSGYDAIDLARLSLLAIAAGATASITGLLRQRLLDSFAQERQHHATDERLSAALDQVDIGIVLLDTDNRAEFINRAFRKYFALADEKASSKPSLIALLYQGRDTGAYELPEEELKAFIADRMEMVRAGDSTPIDIKLRDGKVLRFHCTALPEGGRMLAYIPETDVVRHTDDPALADHYRSLRGASRNPVLSQQIRAAE
ncbi:PAS-domain containing protein [Bradyrhizobium sp.]|uniref:PAS-domain containing protein n=1 Tax=Bradyrhizobium sp. TaxID=376 RepID=UPI003C561470